LDKGNNQIQLNKVNYQKVLDSELSQILLDRNSSGYVPKLLLHSCCAPCSSYVLEYLSHYFEITLFFYNPNISPKTEYDFRFSEQKRLVEVFNLQADTKNRHKISVANVLYEPEQFISNVRGHETDSEGGKRCEICFNLRLEETAKYAKENNFDYFTTTLSISPMKNAETLNRIGLKLGEKYGVKYLVSDFKKKNGYKRSIELSKEFELYRQNYCGCIFSKKEHETNK
jgi:predicted adenine nucleotide alpha hydrolase (AANH) superfamily ATPase